MSDGLTQFSLLINAALGLGWVYSFYKSRLETRKLRQEIKTLDDNRLKTLHEYDEFCATADRHYTECSTAYLTAVKSATEPTVLNEARDKLCRAIIDLIEKQRNHFEISCRVNEDAAKKCETLLETTVHEIRQWKRYLQNVNNRKVIDFVKRQPLKISKYPLVRMRDAAAQLPISPTTKEFLYKEIDELVTSSGT
jgi:hypothetical protein